MLPPNVASWHMKYHTLKEFLKGGRSRKVTLDSSPSHPSSLKQIIKLSCERYLTVSEGGRYSCHKDWEFGVKKSVQTMLVKSALTFLVNSSFAILDPNPFFLSVLHKYIVFVVKV